MLITEKEEWFKMREELSELFGEIQVNSLWSHLSRMAEQLERLTKSRDKWRAKYDKLKQNGK